MSDTGARPLELLPGLAVLVAVAAIAGWIGSLLPYVNALVLAVGIGALVGNAVDVPSLFGPGIDRHKLLLETGIVLLGANVPLDRIVTTGPIVVGLVFGTVAFGVVFVETLSRVAFSLPGRSGSLLAAGASICGVSAVVAVARGIDADRETLAYVVGAVLLFDAVTLVVFPAIGGALDLPDRIFGVWVGLAMFSTGPVAAAGFAYSPVAGRWATITKLVRNALIGVVAVGYALAYVRADEGDADLGPGAVWTQFPKFLVGFLAVVAVANAGVLSPAGHATLATASEWLFALAFAGVGFSIRIDEMRAAGGAPIGVLFVYLLVASSLTLGAAWFLL